MADAPPGSRVRSTSDADDASIAIPATAIRKRASGCSATAILCRCDAAAACASSQLNPSDALSSGTWHGAEFNSVRCRRPSASASHSAAADDDDAQLENTGTIDRLLLIFHVAMTTP